MYSTKVLFVRHTFKSVFSLQGHSEALPYSHGALAVAVILASASLVPIVVVAVTRLFSGDRDGYVVDGYRDGYQPPIKRVATDASTLPMMTAVASDQKISDVEDERDQLRMADTEQNQPRNL